MINYRIEETAKQYMHYDMIQANTELPNFPDYRTRLLYVCLTHGSEAKDEQELFALVTSLAQMALDTHDLVTESADANEKQAMRSRQLKVLAGDYFSSRFYHLLSQAGHIEMTKMLAGAICEVNRLKMNMYLKMKQLKLSAEEYVLQSVNIRMQLYLVFSGWMSHPLKSVWPDLLHAYTKCELLLEEIERTRGGNFRSGWAYWHILQVGTKEERKAVLAEEADKHKLSAILLKHNVKSQLFQMLENQFRHIADKLKSMQPDKIVQEMNAIVEPLRRYLSTPSAIEEI